MGFGRNTRSMDRRSPLCSAMKMHLANDSPVGAELELVRLVGEKT